MAGTDPIRPREVTEEDLPELAALLRESWPEVDWPLRFRRQWLENPAWEPGISMGWVHEIDDELQSFFGSIPIPYRVDGRDGRAFAATSLYVRSAFRRCGWARVLVECWLAQHGGELWVNATSNERSMGIFEQLGLQKYLRHDHEAEALWVTRPLAHARQAAARRIGGGSPRWYHLPIALAGAATLWWQRPRPGDAAGWSWKRVARCADEIDELWARESRTHPTTMRRDSRTLSWLYLEGPNAGRNTLLLGRDAQGRARALAGFREAREESRLHQTDLFGALGEPGALASLIRTVSRHAAEAGLSIARLWIPTASGLDAELERAGLSPRPCEGEIYHRGGESSGTPHFTDLDGDRCLDLLV